MEPDGGDGAAGSQLSWPRRLLLAGCALPGDRGARATRRRPHPPVVFVVFDEFPARRPAAARRAASTPSASRTSPSWRRSPPGSRTRTRVTTRPSRPVPAILDGRLPRPRDGARTCAATSRASSMCWTGSATRCSRSSRRRPSARPRSARARARGGPACSTRLAGGGRPARFHQLGRARSGTGRSRPSTSTTRCMPHEPWIYLPSGHQSRPAGNDPIEGINQPSGFDDPDLIDAQPPAPPAPGGLHRPPGRASCWRASGGPGCSSARSVVVTADHGYSFQVGVKSRRLISDDNVEEIAPVPLFVKAPGRRSGRVDDEPRAQHRHGRDDRRPARHEGLLRAGRALGVLARGAGARSEIEDPDARLRAGGAIGLRRADERRRRARRRRGHASCSAPAREPLLYGDPWASAYRIGPHPELLGRRVPALRVLPSGAARSARVTRQRGLFAHVDPREQVLPDAGDRAAPRSAARRAPRPGGRGERPHRATSAQLRLYAASREYFSLMVPETVAAPRAATGRAVRGACRRRPAPLGRASAARFGIRSGP